MRGARGRLRRFDSTLTLAPSRLRTRISSRVSNLSREAPVSDAVRVTLPAFEHRAEGLGRPPVMLEDQTELLGRSPVMLEDRTEHPGRSPVMLEDRTELLGRSPVMLEDRLGSSRSLRSMPEHRNFAPAELTRHS